jgi:DNA-binding NarL/FixJ family response regulator
MDNWTLRVFIVSDQPVSRIGLVCLFDQSGSFQVVRYSGSDGEVAIEARKLMPAVILLDCHLTRKPEQLVSAEIAMLGLGSKLIALCPPMDAFHIRRLFEAGIEGCLLKTESPETILRAIREMAVGEARSTQKTSHILFTRNTSAPTDLLSRREREVIELLVKGYRNRQIAEALSIEEGTVRFHLWNTFRKLGIKNRTQAVMAALDQGWIAAH